MRLIDNSSYSLQDVMAHYPHLIDKLQNKTLHHLAQYENIFVFPPTVKLTTDLADDQMVFETRNDQIIVGNAVGFIGYQDEELHIQSRFSDDVDYFLHYMLQKVLSVNLVNLKTSLSTEERLYQFLVYLFPKYLQEAMRKGLFKQYKRFSYNDANVKGTIDMARHIRLNSPFVGRVAYSTRAFTYDNDLMQLVRHTIEFIRATVPHAYQLLNASPRIKEYVAAVIQCTPSFNVQQKQQIIYANQKNRVRHAYYVEYQALQQLCIMILTYEKHHLGHANDAIHGILFDVAWLWEEYVATLLPASFCHPENKQKSGAISLFCDRTRSVYPDFYDKEAGIVLDAKYKRLKDGSKGIGREDLYQIITYLHVLPGKRAGVIYPSIARTSTTIVGELNGYGGHIFKQSLQIPQHAQNYDDFATQMAQCEQQLKAQL